MIHGDSGGLAAGEEWMVGSVPGIFVSYKLIGVILL